MRIYKIIIGNFRQLRNMKILFEKHQVNDLHIFIAKNGSGKTNILNAINWCLYGEEPHLSIDSKQLPMLNLKTIAESSPNDIRNVKVEIWTSDDNRTIIFSRKEAFRINPEGQKPTSMKIESEVKFFDSTNNTKIINDKDEVDIYINRFVPLGIREFFFFDGERLDKYFLNAKGEKIKKAIFDISQIYLLENIEKNLTTLVKDLRRNASFCDPCLNEKEKMLQEYETKLDENREKIRQNKKQIDISKGMIKKYEEFFRGIPDVKKLEDKRRLLMEEKGNKETLYIKKKKMKQDLLMKFGENIYFYPYVKKMIEAISSKRDKKELPPNVHPDFLRQILKTEVCSICHNKLDDKSETEIKLLLNQIEQSSELGEKLLKAENPLINLKANLGNQKKEIDNITEEISQYERELSQYQRDITEIDTSINGFDLEKITTASEDRKRHESLLDQNLQKQGVLDAQEKSFTVEKDKLKKEYETALGREQKAKSLNKQREFCEEAIGVVRKVAEKILKDTRERIQLETKERFFSLLWKKETFKDVIIDNDYNIDLIHQMGYECLGTVSAAERELLALSFTLALHNVSGFPSPLIIDTPVARVSDTNRENFSKVLMEVSKSKQTILLFTPDEYSQNINCLLDSFTNNKFILKPSSDEKETILEV